MRVLVYIFETLEEMLENHPDNTVKVLWNIYGDNPDDIEAAHSSGSVAIGIRATDQQALYDAGADVVLASVNELENWL